MLAGHLEYRTALRVPLKTDIAIVFKRDGQELTQGQAIDISLGGLKFITPHGSLPFVRGEEITFIFDLPGHGLTQASAVVVYMGTFSEGSETMSIYGAKFNDLSLGAWNYIVEYVQGVVCADQEQPKVASMSARETSPRTVAGMPIHLRLKSGRVLTGRLKDVTFGGARVLLNEMLDLKEAVLVDFVHAEKRLRVKAFCVWCFPFDEENRLYLAGVYFSNLNAEEFNDLKSLITMIGG